MSSLSLNAAVRTCHVQAGEASRIESDRFLNPNKNICIPWNNMNSKGQIVCEDSFYTKRAGCNSADDRVSVENLLRPKYWSYIGLESAGLAGDIYGSNVNAHMEAGSSNRWEKSRLGLTGNFGNQFGATNYQTCGHDSYEKAMAQVAKTKRDVDRLSSGYDSQHYRNASGCGH
jgi:hypothetical protein